MSVTFTKLFSSITESTVWCEPSNTRIVWITMLAMADRKGRVWASIPGLANRARVPLTDTETALQLFLGPDKYSRTSDHEGRRIEAIDGGWHLLNYDKYRATRDDDTRREQTRTAVAKHRSNVSQCKPDVSHGKPIAEAEAEAVDQKITCDAANGDPQGKLLPRLPSRPKKPSDPNVKLIIDHYHASYLARFKSPPPIAGGKCGAIAKRLLTGRTLEDAKWLISAHLSRAPEMYERKNLYGLEHVLSSAPILLARRAKEERGE